MMSQAASMDFRKRVKGELLLPTDGGYDEGRRIFNAMIDRRPAVIVRCAAREDVVAAVQFAREQNLPVSVKGAGHNVSGNAVCEGGVMIDCSRMKGVRVDRQNRLAIAEPGPTLGEFDKATTAEGFFTTLGVVSKTGIAGLTLGGGLGWLMGKYGLACDNLVAADVVTAQGTRVRASAQENPDLLWGLRGGGGNFGIVTQFEYRLHPMEPITGGLLLYPIDRARDVLRHFCEVTAKYPGELTYVQALLNAADGKPVAAIAVGYCGDVVTAEKVLAPIRAFGPPMADLVAPVPYTQQQSMMDDAYPSGLYYYWKASMMDTISEDAARILEHYFKTRPSPLTQMFFEHIHGAAARVPQTATAFAHRREQYNFSVLAFWKDAKETDANMAWLQSFWKEMQPHLGRGAYVNYLSQEGADRVREAYGPNYDRLVALKNKYDPTNFFRYNQNVQPSRSAAEV